MSTNQIDNMNTATQVNHHHLILQLRLLVGFLGEKAQYSWWTTSLFEPSSRLFLEPIFLKTTRAAQYHGVKEVARRLHDEHIGVGNVYHLFRLPEEVEQDLHRFIQEAKEDSNLTKNCCDKESALKALQVLSGRTVEIKEGPIAIGKIEDLQNADTIQKISAAYLTAFQEGIKVYPYLLC